MRFRLIGCTAVLAAAGGIFVACKTADSSSRRNKAGGNGGSPGAGAPEAGVASQSVGSSNPLDLFANWYERDTAGENSGAPKAGGAGVAGVVPPMHANTHTAGGRAGSSMAHTDALSKVCLDEAGDSTEHTQSLFCIPVPQPTMTDIVDQKAAILLGKALFWDIQVGGDGQTACASCHFSGGADNRQTNTLHPGPNGLFESTAVKSAGQLFSKGSPSFDFPAITGDDRVGSQGVVGAVFVGINSDPTVAADNCTPNQDFPFFAHRRVTGRNTPSVIAAVFNNFNFWDGRANPNFNGFDPFGATGNTTTPAVLSAKSSLASQAVGPPNNGTEMSCDGRAFNGLNSLAAKLIARKALAKQSVSPTDSVLGRFSAYPAKGMTCYGRDCTYSTLIGKAFGAEWNPDSANIEIKNRVRDNFSRLWGQALQAYQATLVPDQTRFDQYAAGKTSLFTPSLIKGLDIFQGRGECEGCHTGAEMTDASVAYSKIARREDQGNDEGFHNLGVSLTAEDLGRAATGPRGVTWSTGKPLKKRSGEHEDEAVVDRTVNFDRGAFKTPSLRNLKLTAPYFHNGGEQTLEEVVDFYARRGGNFPNRELSDELREINIEDPADQTALVDFLRNGLLDCRVEKFRAPFDRPELPLLNGRDGSLLAIGAKGTGSCRLSATVAPTTLNCVTYPGICDTDKQLLATSRFLDMFQRLPTAAEVASSNTVPAMWTAANRVTYQKVRMQLIVEQMLGRNYDATFASYLNDESNAMRRSIAQLPQYYTRSGGTNALFLTQLMKDLSGRAPTAAELAAATSKLTAAISSRGLAFDYLAGLTDSHAQRIRFLYLKYLRRLPVAPEGGSRLSDLVIGRIIVESAEYKAFAVARDDI